MTDIEKLSKEYTVRRMTDPDADDILELCLGNTQYYEYCGKQPSRELILSDLHLTPPGKDPSSKHYVGFYDGNTLAAVLDLIDGYPEPDVAFIGFFMMNKALQGKQLGSGIIGEVCSYLKEAGLSSVMLAIDKGNPQSTHFWKKNGFVVIREVDQEGSVLLVAEKTL